MMENIGIVSPEMLGRAKQVRRKFRAAHVIQNPLALFQAFPTVNVFLFQSAIKPHVPVILKDGVVYGLDDAGILGRIGQMDVMAAHLFPQHNPPILFDMFVRQFLPSRLDSEIGLALRHDLLAGIGVLNSQVTRVTRHEDGLDRSFRAAADGDHFGDVNEMVFEAVSAVETGHFGLLDNRLKIAVVAVAEDLGKLAARPKLHPRIVRAFDPLERRRMPAGCLRNFLRHYSFPPLVLTKLVWRPPNPDIRIGIVSPEFPNSRTGAAIWTTTFITLGYLLGPQVSKLAPLIHEYLVYVAIAVAAMIVLTLVAHNLWKRRAKAGG